MEKILYNRFLLVKDNFYDDPAKVISAAKNAIFYEPENVTGFRSTTVYHPLGIKKKLEKILGIKINRWDQDPALENGVFYHGFARGKEKEVPGVHADYPANDITVLIYLTPIYLFDCGTSLWQHKRTGVTDAVSSKDAKRFGIKLSELRDELERDTKNRSKWIELDRVGHLFNRMVAYPSGVFHSATKHFGDSMKNGRIYQTFRIGVDWSTHKLNQ
ncbi:MAG: hypothetical protein IPI50_06445 [Saprospiraceae bacterium]|nr:hypothetical protein [Saprospiraceae bacterium]